MDIPALSMAMSQSRVQEAASIAVLGKSLSVQRLEGEALMKLLDSAAPLADGQGSIVDIRA